MSDIIIPAEWETHKAIWTCWPSAADLWEDNLIPAQGEVATMIKALMASTPEGGAGDKVHVLASGSQAAEQARAVLPQSVEVHNVPFGDIWLRDTGPIFAKLKSAPVALRFGFNGWGGKYDLDHDDTVGDEVARLSTAPVMNADFILEGGAVDHDGEGTVLTTRQCVLNPNRHAGWTQSEADAHFARSLGAKKILWLSEGLLNDHTDGHVDNIARFIGPARVMMMQPFGDDDPNREVFGAIAAELSVMTDAAGRRLEVIKVPSPGLVSDDEGRAMPASHLNFVIGNSTVVVPHYNTPSADAALRVIAAAFPGRRVVGVTSKALLSGGGSFHCITQQEPA